MTDRIKQRLHKLSETPFEASSFILAMLAAYGIKSPVKPDETGNLNWSEHLVFQVCERGQPGVVVEELVDKINANPEVFLPYFVMATDGVDIYCASPVLATIKYFPLNELGDCFDLLMPLATLRVANKRKPR